MSVENKNIVVNSDSFCFIFKDFTCNYDLGYKTKTVIQTLQKGVTDNQLLNENLSVLKRDLNNDHIIYNNLDDEVKNKIDNLINFNRREVIGVDDNDRVITSQVNFNIEKQSLVSASILMIKNSIQKVVQYLYFSEKIHGNVNLRESTLKLSKDHEIISIIQEIYNVSQSKECEDFKPTHEECSIKERNMVAAKLLKPLLEIIYKKDSNDVSFEFNPENVKNIINSCHEVFTAIGVNKPFIQHQDVLYCLHIIPQVLNNIITCYNDIIVPSFFNQRRNHSRYFNDPIKAASMTAKLINLRQESVKKINNVVSNYTKADIQKMFNKFYPYLSFEGFATFNFNQDAVKGFFTDFIKSKIGKDLEILSLLDTMNEEIIDSCTKERELGDKRKKQHIHIDNNFDIKHCKYIKFNKKGEICDVEFPLVDLVGMDAVFKHTSANTCKTSDFFTEQKNKVIKELNKLLNYLLNQKDKNDLINNSNIAIIKNILSTLQSEKSALNTLFNQIQTQRDGDYKKCLSIKKLHFDRAKYYGGLAANCFEEVTTNTKLVKAINNKLSTLKDQVDKNNIDVFKLQSDILSFILNKSKDSSITIETNFSELTEEIFEDIKKVINDDIKNNTDHTLKTLNGMNYDGNFSLHDVASYLLSDDAGKLLNFAKNNKIEIPFKEKSSEIIFFESLNIKDSHCITLLQVILANQGLDIEKNADEIADIMIEIIKNNDVTNDKDFQKKLNELLLKNKIYISAESILSAVDSTLKNMGGAQHDNELVYYDKMQKSGTDIVKIIKLPSNQKITLRGDVKIVYSEYAAISVKEFEKLFEKLKVIQSSEEGSFLSKVNNIVPFTTEEINNQSIEELSLKLENVKKSFKSLVNYLYSELVLDPEEIEDMQDRLRKAYYQAVTLHKRIFTKNNDDWIVKKLEAFDVSEFKDIVSSIDVVDRIINIDNFHTKAQYIHPEIKKEVENIKNFIIEFKRHMIFEQQASSFVFGEPDKIDNLGCSKEILKKNTPVLSLFNTATKTEICTVTKNSMDALQKDHSTNFVGHEFAKTVVKRVFNELEPSQKTSVITIFRAMSNFKNNKEICYQFVQTQKENQFNELLVKKFTDLNSAEAEEYRSLKFNTFKPRIGFKQLTEHKIFIEELGLKEADTEGLKVFYKASAKVQKILGKLDFQTEFKKIGNMNSFRFFKFIEASNCMGELLNNKFLVHNEL